MRKKSKNDKKTTKKPTARFRSDIVERKSMTFERAAKVFIISIAVMFILFALAIALSNAVLGDIAIGVIALVWVPSFVVAVRNAEFYDDSAFFE